MKVDTFRKELHDAYIAGIQWTMNAAPSDDEIKKQGGALVIIGKAANRYATERILANHDKLEPMS